MAELWKSFLASVDKLYELKQFKSLKELLGALEPADVAEILAENEGIHLSVSTLRRLRIAAGVSSPRKRRSR